MFLNNLKNLTILVVFSSRLIFPVSAAFAEDVGDQYYPSATDGVSSIENMERMHHKKMQAIEDEYKKKMAELEKRYNEKNANDDAHTNKMIELREQSAALKEERMKKREELENAFITRQQELNDSAIDKKTNQYLTDVKGRKEYFENKAKKDAANGGGK